MSMINVTCQDCGRVMEFNEHYVAGMLATGDLVKGFTRTQKRVLDRESDGSVIDRGGEADDYHEKVFDICRKCKVLSTPRPGDVEILREQRIQYKIKALHEMRPDLTFEERCHLAVEEEFDPKYEPNKAFREFLQERQGL